MATQYGAHWFGRARGRVRIRRNSSIRRRRNPMEVYQYRDQKRTSTLVKEAAIGEQPYRVLFGCSDSPPAALVLKSSKIDEDCSRSHSFPTGPMGLLHGFAHSPTFLWCILLVVSAHKIRNKSISTTGSKSQVRFVATFQQQHRKLSTMQQQQPS